MKTWIVIAVLGVISMVCTVKAHAQQPASQKIGTAVQDSIDEDIKLFRKDVRSQKKQIIAANMSLTDMESQQFWPIYDRYTGELASINDKKYALLKEYSTAMSGEQAERYVKGRAQVDNSVMELRLKYFALFRKVLSGQATALFFQLDWRLGLLIDLQLASQTPLIEP